MTSLSELDEALERVTGHAMVRPDRRTGLGDHPALDSGYELTTLYARAMLQLDGAGELIVSPESTRGPNWHQLDFEVRSGSEGDRSQIEIAPRPPDFLVAGEYFERFITALQTQHAIGVLAQQVQAVDGTGEAALEAFLFDRLQSERAFIARIDQDDHDLVFLDAELAGQRTRLLYIVKFDVTSFPDVQPTVRTARLIGVQKEGEGWHALDVPDQFQDRISRYMTRTFRIARTWRSGLIQET